MTPYIAHLWRKLFPKPKRWHLRASNIYCEAYWPGATFEQVGAAARRKVGDWSIIDSPVPGVFRVFYSRLRPHQGVYWLRFMAPTPQRGDQRVSNGPR